MIAHIAGVPVEEPRSSVWQRPGEEPVGAEFETGTDHHHGNTLDLHHRAPRQG